MELQFNVNQQSITRTDVQLPIANSKNYLTAKFTFTSDWNGISKTALFTQGKNSYAVLLVNNVCNVPNEVLANADGFTVSVFGGDLITANVAPVIVGKSGLKAGQVPATATPSIYNQIINTVTAERQLAANAAIAANAAADSATAVKELAANAATAANAAAADILQRAANGEFDGAPGEKGDPGEPGFTTEYCSAYHNTSQTAANETYVALAMNSEYFDGNTIHDNTTNNSRLTCKAAGKYLVSAFVAWPAISSSNLCALGIRKNGTTILCNVQQQPMASYNLEQSVCALVELAVNDYIEAFVWHNTGTSRTIPARNGGPQLSMVKVA